MSGRKILAAVETALQHNDESWAKLLEQTKAAENERFKKELAKQDAEAKEKQLTKLKKLTQWVEDFLKAGPEDTMAVMQKKMDGHMLKVAELTSKVARMEKKISQKRARSAAVPSAAASSADEISPAHKKSKAAPMVSAPFLSRVTKLISLTRKENQLFLQAVSNVCDFNEGLKEKISEKILEAAHITIYNLLENCLPDVLRTTEQMRTHWTQYEKSRDDEIKEKSLKQWLSMLKILQEKIQTSGFDKQTKSHFARYLASEQKVVQDLRNALISDKAGSLAHLGK